MSVKLEQHAEAIAIVVLEPCAGPFYVAANVTQRRQAISEAAKLVKPKLDALLADLRRDLAANAS